MFDDVKAEAGGVKIVYGWVMAEALVKLGNRS